MTWDERDQYRCIWILSYRRTTHVHCVILSSHCVIFWIPDLLIIYIFQDREHRIHVSCHGYFRNGPAEGSKHQLKILFLNVVRNFDAKSVSLKYFFEVSFQQKTFQIVFFFFKVLFFLKTVILLCKSNTMKYARLKKKKK